MEPDKSQIPESQYIDIGKKLSKKRKELNLSQGKVSQMLLNKQIYVSQKMYSNLETGAIKNPEPALVAALSAILGIDNLVNMYFPELEKKDNDQANDDSPEKPNQDDEAGETDEENNSKQKTHTTMTERLLMKAFQAIERKDMQIAKKDEHMDRLISIIEKTVSNDKEDGELGKNKVA